MFRPLLINIRCYKIVLWRLLGLLFSSKVGCEALQRVCEINYKSKRTATRAVMSVIVCRGYLIRNTYHVPETGLVNSTIIRN
jgi:hypothetical protein